MREDGFERVLGGVCAPRGFLASGVSCGIKGGGKPDLALVYSRVPASATGVFTSNEVKSASLLVTAEKMSAGEASAILVNSGNANSMTGERGIEDAKKSASLVEKKLGLAPGSVLVASTGVIGEYLPMEKLEGGIDLAVEELSPGGNTDAAKAITTTDTYPKELAVELEINGRAVRIGSMAKGSGMIHPNMATMIVIITTDLALDADLMRGMLSQAVEWSFNRISVDGDQSSNDVVLMMANGSAFSKKPKISESDAEEFFKALCWLTGNLAMALVKDGEGASKLLRLVVNGASDDDQAVRVARAVANSNLVKCAFYGGLPAWGRIAMAAGNAGAGIQPEKMEIRLGDFEVASGGRPVEHDQKELARIMERGEVEITIDLGLGEGSAYFLTSDLTPEYVLLNSSKKS